MKRHETLVEKRIREAMEEGAFDNLAGKGEPLDLSENPFEDPDLRTVHRLLRNAGFAPAWLEERKDIAREFEECKTRLGRAWTLFGGSSSHPEWERTLREFKEKVIELNQRIRLNNLKSPSAVFHTKHKEPDKLLEAVTRTSMPSE
ncbi:MAG TPA: DnaJ family domain-containing protein [Pyrinomonadaceae bacterium]|nr:DnaJ family domain-containing protein [Pyrinomonadaceae bacterium]